MYLYCTYLVVLRIGPQLMAQLPASCDIICAGDTPNPAAEVLIDLKGLSDLSELYFDKVNLIFIESAKRKRNVKARSSPRKRTSNVTYSDSSPKKILMSVS